MKFLHAMAGLVVWLATFALLVLPALVAVDRGGILHWTQYAIGLVVLPVAVLSVLAIANPHDRVPLRGLAILMPLAGIAGFAWFQTLPLPDSLAQLLAGGTLRVINDWLTPIAGAASAAAVPSVSISPVDTGHAAAFLTLLLPVGLAASLMMRTRGRLAAMLLGLALVGASVAALGIYRQSAPDGWVYLFDAYVPFAGFVNRNNAALALNLGLAASLGVLAWRMVALHDVELDDPQNDWSDVLGLIYDPRSLLAALCGATCVAGLLVCGSRGGLVGGLAGGLLAAGYVRTRRGVVITPVLMVFLAAAAALLFAPFKLPWLTTQRLAETDGSIDSMIENGRWPHWQDGWSAAIEHLPAGSGVSTYGYAYLPHQNLSSTSWFQHADNLWLEIFVETGLVGLVLSALAMGLWGWSLYRLSESPDPIDQGVRVSGWFAIASLTVSQLFDFGLILPANTLAVVILAAAAVTRASTLASPWARQSSDDEDRPRLRLQSTQGLWRRRLTLGVIVVGVLAAGGAAAWRLRQDARAEYAFSLIRAGRVAAQSGDQRSEQLSIPAVKAVAQRPYPSVNRWLAELWIDRGRLRETLESNPSTVRQFRERYEQRAPFTVTLDYSPINTDDDPTSSAAAYRKAEVCAVAGLCACPLDPRPRDLLIALHRTTATAARLKPGVPADRTSQCIAQLKHFYNNNASRLRQLGDRAIAAGLPIIASECYAAAIDRRPENTGAILRDLLAGGHLQYGDEAATDQLRLLDVVPRRSRPMRQAAELVVDQPDVGPAFLQAASETIDCVAQTAAERAECQMLLARLARRLDDPAMALARYKKAVWLQPGDAEIRLTMIRLLDSLGRRREADAAIREAIDKVDDRTVLDEFIENRN